MYRLHKNGEYSKCRRRANVSFKEYYRERRQFKDHTTLVAAVKAAGLVETLEGAGPFTVFAPTNEAFDMLQRELLKLYSSQKTKRNSRASLPTMLLQADSIQKHWLH